MGRGFVGVLTLAASALGLLAPVAPAAAQVNNHDQVLFGLRYFTTTWRADEENARARRSQDVGHQSIGRNANFGSPDYLDFTAGITVTAFTLDFTAQVIGTSLRTIDCANTNFCKVRPYFSVSKSF